MSNDNDFIFIGAKVPKELHQRIENAAQSDFRSMTKTLAILVAEALDARDARRDRKKA